MKLIISSFIALIPILPMYSFAQTTIDYVTSVQVNGIELNQPVAANQVDKIFGKTKQKISKEYSDCTANYVYSTQYKNNKQLEFEIFPEENAQIKSNTYYKTNNNFQQLNTTKGRVWLTWSTANHLTEQLKLNQKIIDSQYTLTQFKKDFPISGKSKNYRVLMLETNQVKKFLKNTSEFEPPYTPSVQFEFKNGVLSSLRINQALAC